jgi:hypothetical protein
VIASTGPVIKAIFHQPFCLSCVLTLAMSAHCTCDITTGMKFRDVVIVIRICLRCESLPFHRIYLPESRGNIFKTKCCSIKSLKFLDRLCIIQPAIIMTTAVDNEPVEMEVELTQSTEIAEVAAKHDSNVIEDDDEEDVDDLLDLINQANDDRTHAIKLLLEVMSSPKDGGKATQIKERAVYDLTRVYCREHSYSDIVVFLETSNFFHKVTKAKCAKVVRQILDIVCSLAPEAYEMQKEICEKIIVWCRREKRTFLRQRVEAKLAAILFHQSEFGEALKLIERLLHELKKIDDKQLLVETHLMESKIHFGLRNIPKAKAALTASRTAANA